MLFAHHRHADHAHRAALRGANAVHQVQTRIVRQADTEKYDLKNFRPHEKSCRPLAVGDAAGDATCLQRLADKDREEGSISTTSAGNGVTFATCDPPSPNCASPADSPYPYYTGFSTESLRYGGWFFSERRP